MRQTGDWEEEFCTCCSALVVEESPNGDDWGVAMRGDLLSLYDGGLGISIEGDVENPLVDDADDEEREISSAA